MDTDDGRQILPIATALQQVDRGRALARASRQLNDLVQAVADTGRPGTFTLTVKVALYKNGPALDVTVTSTTKAPQADDGTSPGIFFHDHGNLTRDDPDQLAHPIIAAVVDGRKATG